MKYPAVKPPAADSPAVNSHSPALNSAVDAARRGGARRAVSSTFAANVRGLTIIEVLISLAMVAVMMSVLSTVVVTNLRHNAVAGQRMQAVQILNYLGRRVTSGDRVVLPAAGGSLTWDYSELADSFPDLLPSESFLSGERAGQVDPRLYRASVRRVGDASLAGATLVHYLVEVCYERAQAEHCASASTVGPARSTPGSPPALPGLY